MISEVQSPSFSGVAGDAKKSESSRIQDAAEQFESLLLASMLRSMREAGAEGWLGGGQDQTSTAAVEFAEEQFAKALAVQGGLGLANLIVDGLKRTR